MVNTYHSEELDTKKKYILRLISLRFIIVTSLLVSAVIIQLSKSVFLPLNPFYYLILLFLAFILLSFAYILLYLLGKYYVAQVYIQIFFDLLLLTALVYLSGGLQGTFYFLYIFDIIAASIVLSKRAAYLTAALSAIFFGLLVDLMYFRIIPYFDSETMGISLGLVINNIFIAWSVFFLVALLMNNLTESLRKTRNDLRQAQKELEIKNRLAVAGEVSAQLAHEIRNPLAAISGSVQVLKDELDLSGEQRELMNIIVGESKRISQSIEQFLNLASPVQKAFFSVDLSALVQETLMLLQRSGEVDGKVQIEGNYKSTTINYYGNSNQFKQLFWNLIKNAIRAMPGGGTLTVDFMKLKRDKIQLRIADTGIGMTEEQKEKAFEPFYSGFGDGRGIGLSVVRRIVDDYKGRININSEPNKGTEVVITLPLERFGRLQAKQK
jgi:two-component system sensor histidine kinase PilS (NtrC family)